MIKPPHATAIDGAHALSQRLDWPHSRAEWAMMADTGRLVTVGAAPQIDATALVTTYEWGAALGMVLIDPSKQKQGIGTALTRRIMTEIASTGAERITLTSSHAAQTLYARMGFEQVGAVAVLEKDMRDDAVCAKQDDRKTDMLSAPDLAGRVAQAFYGDCTVRVKMLAHMMQTGGPAVVLHNAQGGVEGFAAALYRQAPHSPRRTLAIGPILSGVEKPETVLDLFTAAARKTDAAAVTCFVYRDIQGEDAAATRHRHNVTEAFNARGFRQKAVLPFMSYQGRRPPFAGDVRVVSPVTLAFG